MAWNSNGVCAQHSSRTRFWDYYETNDKFLVRVAKKTQKLYIFTFCISCISKLFHSSFLLVLRIVRFSEDFIWYGKKFQTFGTRYFKIFGPNLTWFDFGISKFSFYFSRVGRFVILSLKMSFTKLGLISLRV